MEVTEETYQSSKITTIKLAEPFKIKAIPFAKGYRIELTLNGNEYLADILRTKENAVVALIRETKKLIEVELHGRLIEDELV